jgi:hypothetical protein
MRNRATIVGAGLVAVFAAAAVAYGAIPGAGGVISACYDKQSGLTRIYDAAGDVPKGCGKSEIALTWNQQGPKGDQGEKGDQGDQGDAGPQGPPGASGHEIVYKAGTRFAEEPGIYGITDTVNCPEGKVAFGGGGSGVIVHSDGTTHLIADVFSSRPNGSAGWNVVFGNRDGSELKDPFALEGVRYEIFVICAATSG